ncbi:MAG: hypothetical protein ACP5NV_01330 [Candidatus Woesearchaeota archaeon]
MENYIGITGFKTPSEINYVSSIARNGTPQIMYGILTTPKSIHSPETIGMRRPALNDIPELLSHVPSNGLAMLHHCSDNREISDEVFKVFSYDGIYDKGLVRALQINQRLPEISEVEKIKNKYQDMKIVLQLEPPDLKNPVLAGQKVQEYGSLIEYVIIDPSRGAGIQLNLENSLQVLNEMPSSIIPIIAGGLSDENVFDIVKHFKKQTDRQFGIDAEGRLRVAPEKLSLEKTGLYIKNAMEAYRTVF